MASDLLDVFSPIRPEKPDKLVAPTLPDDEPTPGANQHDAMLNEQTALRDQEIAGHEKTGVKTVDSEGKERVGLPLREGGRPLLTVARALHMVSVVSEDAFEDMQLPTTKPNDRKHLAVSLAVMLDKFKMLTERPAAPASFDQAESLRPALRELGLAILQAKRTTTGSGSGDGSSA